MKTTQAWVWLTVAVTAAGLNASYHDGGLQWAHRIAEQVGHGSRAVVALATGRADQFLEEARLATRDSGAPRSARVVLTRVQEQVQEKMAGGQQQVAWVQEQVADGEQGIAQIEEMSARQQERLARLEEMRARVQERLAERTARCRVASAMHNAAFVVTPACTRVRVHVPAVQIPEIRIPEIRVPEVRVPEVRFPAIHVGAPTVQVEMADAGPV